MCVILILFVFIWSFVYICQWRNGEMTIRIRIEWFLLLVNAGVMYALEYIIDMEINTITLKRVINVLATWDFLGYAALPNEESFANLSTCHFIHLTNSRQTSSKTRWKWRKHKETGSVLDDRSSSWSPAVSLSSNRPAGRFHCSHDYNGSTTSPSNDRLMAASAYWPQSAPCLQSYYCDSFRHRFHHCHSH